MKSVKKVMMLAAVAGMAAVWISLSPSTKRYIVHVGKQLPYLPYRYFI